MEPDDIELGRFLLWSETGNWLVQSRQTGHGILYKTLEEALRSIIRAYEWDPKGNTEEENLICQAIKETLGL